MLSKQLLACLCIYKATIVMRTSRMWCTRLMGIHALFLIYLISYSILNILTASVDTNVLWFIWTSSPYPGSEILSRQVSAHLCIYADTVLMHSSKMWCTGLI